MKNRLRILTIIIFLFLSYKSEAQWISTNGPYEMAIMQFAFSPNNDVWVASWFHNLLYSKDDGKTWQSVENLDYQYCNSLAIDSLGTIYVGGYGFVWKSSDNGLTWILVLSMNKPAWINVIKIDKNNNIFAGTEGQGLYRSIDSGNSWEQITNGIGNNGIWSLFISNNNFLLLGTAGNGIFKSTDYGNNWFQTSDGLETFLIGSWVTGGIINDSYGNIYAGTNHGMYISTNSGLHWNLAIKGMPSHKEIVYDSREVTFCPTVWDLSKDQYGNLYAATDTGFYNLKKGSDTWVKIPFFGDSSTNLVNVDRNNKIVVESNQLYFSKDFGISWEKYITKGAGLANATVSTLAVDSSGTLYAGAQDIGVQKSTDNGNTWIQFSPKGLSVTSIKIGLNKEIFIGTSGEGIVCTKDKGANWTAMNNGLPDNPYVQSIAINGSNIYVGLQHGGSLYQSKDNGNTWELINSDLTISWSQRGLNNIMITSIVIDSRGYIFLATNGDGIYCTIDNGKTWNKMNSGLTSLSVGSISINSSGEMYAIAAEGIYISSNNGNSWQEIYTEKNKGWFYSLFIDSNDRIFIGSSSNDVCFSSDKGNSWISTGSGLPQYYQYYITSFAITDSNVFAGTHNKGVWRRPLNEIITTVKNMQTDLPKNFSLEQNYPNPFNPTTTIKFSIPSVETFHGTSLQHVVLKVYDLLGREVATLVNEEKAPGNYEVKFDGTNLASGIYFYRLHAGDYYATKKLTLVK